MSSEIIWKYEKPHYEILLEKIEKLQKELEEEKEKNKKLNLENQALFESINCNDDNMLARRYQRLQKELEHYKEKEQAETDDFENRDRWE